MIMNNKSIASLCLCTCLWGTTAWTADGVETPDPVDLNVFGTLGAVYHDASGLEFRRTSSQPRGARAGQLAFGTDSMLGAQFDFHPVDSWGFVTQALSRQRPDSSWTPQVTWAFLRLTPDPDWTLRLGRVGLDLLIESEARSIGYSYLPIRPVHEIVASIPMDHVDGADVSYRRPLGTGIARAQVLYGIADTDHSIGGRKVHAGRTRVRSMVLSYQQEAWLGRAFYGLADAKDTGDSETLVETLNAVGLPQTTQVAADLDIRGAYMDVFGGDLTYESGPATLQTAYFRQFTRGRRVLIPDGEAFSMLAGYRIGPFTPYINYGRAMREQLPYSSGIPLLSVELALLDAYVNGAVANAQFDQRTAGAGLRYDAAEGLSVKFQVDRIRAGYSQIVLQDRQSTPARKQLTLFSATLDFKF